MSIATFDDCDRSRDMVHTAKGKVIMAHEQISFKIIAIISLAVRLFD